MTLKQIGPRQRGDADEARKTDRLAGAIDLPNSRSLTSLQVAVAPTGTLADLAAQIGVAHAAATAAARDGLGHAIAAGDLLIEAKAQVSHGQGLPWLADRCTMSERTAQLYMRLAKHRSELVEADPQRVADLSARGAVRLLAAPKFPERRSEERRSRLSKTIPPARYLPRPTTPTSPTNLRPAPATVAGRRCASRFALKGLLRRHGLKCISVCENAAETVDT